MKKMVLVFFLMVLSFVLWSGNPQNVFIQVQDSGGNAPLSGNLTFSASINGHSSYGTLTQNSYDCCYPTPEYEGYIKINLGQFSNWNDNDVMSVTVNVTTGEPEKTVEFTLDAGAPGYQIFTLENGFQMGIIDDVTQNPDGSGEMVFNFNYGNTSRANEIQVNVNSNDTNPAHEMTITQYERASYTIPNYAQTLDMGFDFDDRDLTDATNIDVEIRWNLPVPDLTTPKLIYKASDGSYWQIKIPTDDDTGTYTDGWDLNDDGAGEPDSYKYGVKFSMTDFTPGSATYTKWAIGENSILDLQPAGNVTISSNVTGTEASSATLTLSWDKVIGADTYDIQVSDSYSGTYSGGTTGITSETGTISLSLGSANTVKYYKIKGNKHNDATDYVDTAKSTLTMAGIGYAVKTTLITNNALVAFPVEGYSSYTNASDLTGLIDECDCVAQWNADTQTWNSMGRIFGNFAGWDTSLDYALDDNVPVVFNVTSGISSIVLSGKVDTSVQFTLKARDADAVTYNYLYLPLDSSITSGQALATAITNCTYVGKFDYDSQDWTSTVYSGSSWNADITIAAGELLRVGLTGSNNITWPSSR